MKYLQLIKAIDAASRQLLGRAAAAVNQSLVIRNWLIGAYIVEFEQRGKDRARHGARLLQTLATDLKARHLDGLGISILERSRKFYLLYPEFRAAIPQSVVAELGCGHAGAIPYTVPTESPLIVPGSLGIDLVFYHRHLRCHDLQAFRAAGRPTGRNGQDARVRFATSG